MADHAANFVQKQIFKCQLCEEFQSISLKCLVSHYNIFHGNDLQFKVTCRVNGCPSVFIKHNSLYRHTKRKHTLEYNSTEVASEIMEVDNNEDIRSSPGYSYSSGENFDKDPESEYEDTDNDSDPGTACQPSEKMDIDIRKSAASFLLKVKERNKISQVAMNAIIGGTSCLVHQVLEHAKHEVMAAFEGEKTELKDAVTSIFDNMPDVFEGLETDHLQSEYIKHNFNYVPFSEEVHGKILLRKKIGSQEVLSTKEQKFIYVPIIQSLTQLLSNSTIRSNILKEPTFAEKGFYDVCDGHLYKDDPYFQENKKALMIILYHDEVEVCNPLSSRAGKHKLDMFYYTVGNLSPKLRSKHSSVRLLAIANAKLVKRYGISKVMESIIADLLKLYSGCEMVFNGKKEIVRGKIVFCAGDTLGQHLWGGYKEGVGVSYQKCRSCYCTFSAMQHQFEEDQFCIRSQIQYDSEWEQISSAKTKSSRDNLKILYGINSKSPLYDLPGFDVTKQLPQDIMHTLLEGVVQYEVRLILLHFINNSLFTLDQLNASIANFQYGYNEVGDKSGPLRDTVFSGNDYKLKQNAAQARLFLHILPFVLDSTNINFTGYEEYYDFLMELSCIVQIIFAPVINQNALDTLKSLISCHLTTFKELFPLKNIIPKQHYLIHLPSLITSLGPLIRSSCFAFESAHNYFKDLARKQNFKNLPLSLAKRHQFLECCNFGDPVESQQSHPLFASQRKIGVPRQIQAAKIPQLRKGFDSNGLCPEMDLTDIHSVSWIIIHGTKYKKSGALMIDINKDPLLPIFGEILNIYLLKDYVYFETTELHTSELCSKFNAYALCHVSNARRFISYESLVDYNVHHIKISKSKMRYIYVKYDIESLLDDYLHDRFPLDL